MRQQQGFTLIELIVAMAVFSLMLLILTAGFLNINGLRNASINNGALQDNAQLLTSTIESQIRGSNKAEVVSGGVLCLDGNTLIKLSPSAPRELMLYGNATDCSGGTPTQMSTDNIQFFFLKFINLTPSLPVNPATGTADRPTISFTMRMGTNGATSGPTAIYPGTSGLTTSCLPAAAKRGTCTVATFTGAATPRGL